MVRRTAGGGRRLVTRLIHRFLASSHLFDTKQRLVTGGYRAMYHAFDRHFSLGGACGLRILDVGCGSGRCVTRLFRPERDFIVGLDLDESYIRLAATLFAPCRFMVGDAAVLPFAPGRFDVVLLSSLIHHLSDEQSRRLLDSLTKAITRTGTILLSEPIWSRNPVSNFLLTCDRGEYVRHSEEYRRLVSDRFHVEREFFFRYAATEFVGFVLRPRSEARQPVEVSVARASSPRSHRPGVPLLWSSAARRPVT